MAFCMGNRRWSRPSILLGSRQRACYGVRDWSIQQGKPLNIEGFAAQLDSGQNQYMLITPSTRFGQHQQTFASFHSHQHLHPSFANAMAIALSLLPPPLPPPPRPSLHQSNTANPLAFPTSSSPPWQKTIPWFALRKQSWAGNPN